MPKKPIAIAFITFFFAGFVCSAQLKLNLGPDTAYCVLEDAEYVLGENMTITGGEEPYRFKWHTTYDIGLQNVFTASDFFKDTTAQFPVFRHQPLGNAWDPFYLTVYDANGDSATDTINVWFTQYGFVLGYITYNIEPGDSILLDYSTEGDAAGGGIEPITLFWNPNDNISDPIDGKAWFKPETTTDYLVYRVDANGCKSEENTAFMIIVSPKAQISELQQSKELPIRQIGDYVMFSNPSANVADIKIYTLSGKLIEEIRTVKDKIDLSEFRNGNTLIVNVTVNGIAGSCLFLER